MSTYELHQTTEYIAVINLSPDTDGCWKVTVWNADTQGINHGTVAPIDTARFSTRPDALAHLSQYGIAA